MFALLSLTLAAEPVGLTEVGHAKTFGIGVSLGSPTSFTLKKWTTPDAGWALYAGGSGRKQVVRGQYEKSFTQLGSWSWAQLDMWWTAGAAAVIRPSERDIGEQIAPGALGGIGATMRFTEVPAEAYIGGPIAVAYPTLWDSDVALVPYVDVVWAVGGRWYF